MKELKANKKNKRRKKVILVTFKSLVRSLIDSFYCFECF